MCDATDYGLPPRRPLCADNFSNSFPRVVAIVDATASVSTATQFYDVLDGGALTNKNRNALSANAGATIYLVTHSGVYYLPTPGVLQIPVTLYAGNLLQGQVFDLGAGTGPQLFGMSASTLYSFMPALATSGNITATSLAAQSGLVGFSFATPSSLWLLSNVLTKWVLSGATWAPATGYAAGVTPPNTASLRGVITRVETPGGPWIAYVSDAGYIMRYDESQAVGTAYSSCSTCWTFVAAANPNAMFRGIQFAPAPPMSPSASPAATPSTTPPPSSTTTPSASPSIAPSPFVSGSIVVLRLGTGAAPMVSNVQYPLFLDSFSTTSLSAVVPVNVTTPVTTVPLPSAGNGLCTGQNSGTGETRCWCLCYLAGCRDGHFARAGSHITAIHSCASAEAVAAIATSGRMHTVYTLPIPPPPHPPHAPSPHTVTEGELGTDPQGANLCA